ncbi:thioredoxin domain-containing protein [Marinibactrum halimedae]|uniref:Spermatogenesis-associated protein 20-like TRX domain-containing protein n=1 Tax=Marinibactrum halimedae TaxID=1444977 RepID=A0AA37TAM5_9GAMM|nr:thioredoxin domain-containing protein [Marinibactrum halimedae]MCD9458950.1 thioredoxin domain-containing protein [Marinibactrum halimedae]GLS26921.1 hypothetical protein GCM10007877_26400 [Marinibactrum halimedae]
MQLERNALDIETSPYLQQHKDQPVRWQAWSAVVLEVASRLDKPIFLSIGYSASHWCHAMAKETFSDHFVASLLNEHFVCIKVDREERPDIDDVYQIGHQLLSGRPGGWPLTLFLCPHTHYPFIAGTYYPRESNSAQLGFVDLIERVIRFYRDEKAQRSKMLKHVKDGYAHIDDGLLPKGETANLSMEPIQLAVKNLLKQADTINGGFGVAPKFALGFQLERLLSAHYEDSPLGRDAKQHLHRTLTIMTKGGIRDMLAGGFFRYSTDATWSIPHFEKMLSDNALLLAVYADASHCLTSPLFAKTARGIARWMMMDMLTEQGAFLGSMDADSDLGEGGYYCWETEELKQVLSEIEFSVLQILCRWEGRPNFFGRWHLQVVRRTKDAIDALKLSEKEVNTHYRNGLMKLLKVRQSRVIPSRDAKIVTSSNAQAIRSLVIAGRVLQEPSMIETAVRCLDFLQDFLWRDDCLYATWQEGKAKVEGFLDDYLFTMEALLEMLQTRWRDKDYRWLMSLATAVMARFSASGQGGFFFSSLGHEHLICRPRSWYDRASPAGNGVAARVFARLAWLTSDIDYCEISKSIVSTAWPMIQRHPECHSSLLDGLAEVMQPTVTVFLRGDSAMAWQRALVEHFGRRIMTFAVEEATVDSPPSIQSLENNSALMTIGASQKTYYQALDELTTAVEIALEMQADEASESKSLVSTLA